MFNKASTRCLKMLFIAIYSYIRIDLLRELIFLEFLTGYLNNFFLIWGKGTEGWERRQSYF